MKKTTVCIIASALMLQAAPLFLHASAADSVKLNVTVATEGEIRLAAEEVTVTDQDDDGKLTINDALIAAHKQNYEGGAAGFISGETDWGLSIQQLWGLDNHGNYGYTSNNVFSNGLTDPISDGDWLYVFAYKDGYSDEYTYFEGDMGKKVQSAKTGDTEELKLVGIYYDGGSGQMKQEPIAGAVITVNGKETSYKTDAEGKVSVPVEIAGEVKISAKHTEKTIIPPLAKLNVTAADTTAAITTTTAITTISTTAATTAKATTSATTTAKAITTKATTKAGTTTKAATTTAGASKTGDTTAIPALAITGVLALGAAYAVRRRDA